MKTENLSPNGNYGFSLLESGNSQTGKLCSLLSHFELQLHFLIYSWNQLQDGQRKLRCLQQEKKLTNFSNKFMYCLLASLYLGVWGAMNAGNVWFDEIIIEEIALANIIRRGGAPISIYNPLNPNTTYTEGSEIRIHKFSSIRSGY